MTIDIRKSTTFILASATAMAIMAPPALARNDDGRIVIKAQSLAKALATIAAETHVPIRVDPREASGVRAHAVSAATTREAITQAIRGTSFVVSGNDSTGYLVSSGGTAMGNNGDITVVAQRNEAERRYLVNTAASSTRDGRSLREQPQSTTVISSKLMADQQIQTVADALRDAAGATVNLGNVQGAPSYTVRGFFAKPLTGGLSDPSGLSQPVVNVERIEVLKGPAALLAGADNLGGSVNIVTKKPITQPLLDLTAEYGSYDDWRTAIDASGALDTEKHVSARLVAQYARADHNAGHYDGRFENLIAPSLRYKNDKFDLTAGIDFSDVRAPAAPYGAFDYSGKLVDLSSKPVGPADSGFRMQTERYYYDGKWSPTNWLTLVSRSQLSLVDTNLKIWALAANLAPSLSLLLQTDELQKTRTVSTDDYARFDFRTGPFKHTLSAGFNYSNYALNDFVPSDTSGSVAVGDLFDGSLTLGAFQPDVQFNYMTRSKQTGFYGQDLIEWGPVHLLGALRQSRYVSTSQIGTAAATTERKSKLTPQVGGVLDLTRRVSVYANYIEGFLPSFYLDRNGTLLPPEETRNIEGGVKWDVLPDRLAFTASVYRIRQSNVPIAIAGLPNRYDVMAGQESRGVEADLTGEILPGWDVAMNYSYGTYKLLEQTATQVVVPGQPEHRYSVFSRYTVTHGPLKSLGGSIGIYGFSKSYVDRAGDDVLPAQTKVDANLYYRFRKLSLNFGVDNLLGKKVYGVTQAETYVPVDPTRTFRLTLTYSVF